MVGEVTINPQTYVPDPQYQMRAEGTDPEAVGDYAETLKNAAEYGRPWPFPALKGVCDTGGNVILYGGFTRLAAAKAAGWAEAPVRVLRGHARDAFRNCLKENADHGQRRTNADKRNVVETALLDIEFGRLSDREIAGMCGVSNKLVSAVHNELISDGRSLAGYRKPSPKLPAPPEVEGEPKTEPPYAPFKASATKPTQPPAKPAAVRQRAAQSEAARSAPEPGYDDGQFSDDADDGAADYRPEVMAWLDRGQRLADETERCGGAASVPLASLRSYIRTMRLAMEGAADEQASYRPQIAEAIERAHGLVEEAVRLGQDGDLPVEALRASIGAARLAMGGGEC